MPVYEKVQHTERVTHSMLQEQTRKMKIRKMLGEDRQAMAENKVRKEKLDVGYAMWMVVKENTQYGYVRSLVRNR